MKTIVILAVFLLSVAAYADNCNPQDAQTDSAQSTRSTALEPEGS